MKIVLDSKCFAINLRVTTLFISLNVRCYSMRFMNSDMKTIFSKKLNEF